MDDDTPLHELIDRYFREEHRRRAHPRDYEPTVPYLPIPEPGDPTVTEPKAVIETVLEVAGVRVHPHALWNFSVGWDLGDDGCVPFLAQGGKRLTKPWKLTLDVPGTEHPCPGGDGELTP